MESMHRAQILFPRALWDRLQGEAARTGQPASDLVRKSVEARLEQTTDARTSRAQALAKIKGIAAVRGFEGIDHDAHLYAKKRRKK